MNTARKGTTIEKEFADFLMDKGFIVHRAIRTKFNRIDIFGCWDIIAKHPRGKDHTFYFQISTRWKYGEELNELVEFPQGILDHCGMVRRLSKNKFEAKLKTKSGWLEIDLDIWLCSVLTGKS